MSRILRKFQKIFAASATNNGQFGSGKTGAKVTSLDLDTIQALSAWDTGWLDAIISAQDLPPLEEMQSTNYVNTSQLAYLFQEGVSEWNTDTTYYDTSIVKKTSTFQLYQSLTNANQGNALTDPTNWKLLVDLTAAASTNTLTSVDGEVVLFSGTGGRTLKRGNALSGLVKAASGILSAAVAGTDFLAPNGNGSGLTGLTGSQISGIVATQVSGLFASGQTWQDVIGSRTAGTSYQNTTGKPIQLATISSNGSFTQVSVDNSTWISVGGGGSDRNAVCNAVVPINWYYRATSGTIANWAELR